MTFKLMTSLASLPLVLGIVCFAMFNRSKISKSLFIHMFFISIWLLDVAILYGVDYINEEQGLWLFRIFRLGPTMSFPAIVTVFYFISKTSYVELKGFFKYFFHKNFIIGLYIWSFLVFIIGIMPQQILELEIIQSNDAMHYFPVYGPLIYVYYTHILLYILCLYLLIRFSFTIKVSHFREFAILLSSFTFVSVIVGVMNFTQVFKLFPSGIAIMLFSVGIFVSFNRMQQKIIEQMQSHIQRTSSSAYLDVNTSSLLHEIRNPLSAIQGFIELLPMVAKSEENFNEILKNMRLANEHLISIVKGFSQFTKTGKLNITEQNINETIEEAKQILLKMFDDKKLNIVVNEDKDIKFYFDKDKIRQVIINLCKNSVEAIPDERENKEIVIQVQEHKDDVYVSIIDNGTGISEDKWNKIFQPFETTKESGMGLGLSIVYNIILSHGGTISVVNSSSEGTHIQFVLPKFNLTQMV